MNFELEDRLDALKKEINTPFFYDDLREIINEKESKSEIQPCYTDLLSKLDFILSELYKYKKFTGLHPIEQMKISRDVQQIIEKHISIDVENNIIISF